MEDNQPATPTDDGDCSVVAIEIEASPWSLEDETKAVLAAAAELDVAVLGYSYVARYSRIRCPR